MSQDLGRKIIVDTTSGTSTDPDVLKAWDREYEPGWELL
jgi:hypothetical protein